MGVIIRNGNAYGGFDKDFTVVDSLESIDNIQKEHLYAVGKKLYYHNGTEWIEFNPDVEIPEAKTINADSKMIVTGNGQGWVQGSAFYTKSFTFPSDYSWPKYINKRATILEGIGDMVAISSKSDTKDLNAPILAVSERAKVFFEEGVDVDISGTTKIYIHESPTVNLDGTPFVKFGGRSELLIEDNSLLKLDDYAGINLTNMACINMNGLAKASKDGSAVGGPSPYFSMQGNSTFLMNSREENIAPLIVAGPESFEFSGKCGRGTFADRVKEEDQFFERFEPASYNIGGIFDLENEEPYPCFRIGKGTHIIADSDDGITNIKIGTAANGKSIFDITSNKESYTKIKFGTVKGGHTEFYVTGSLFYQMSGASHFEMHNQSQIIMRGILNNEKPWHDQTETARILSSYSSPNHTISGEFNNSYEKLRSSPLMALYDAPTFVMRGVWPEPTSNDTNVPENWTGRAVQFSGSPLFEMIERSSFIMEAGSKILMKDSAQIKASQTGYLEINADGIIINGIEISNGKLRKLLYQLGE